MNSYELYIVLDADAEEDEANAAVERATGLITAGHGGQAGEVIKVQDRGKRRLAYRIRKKREGWDFVINFQTPPQVLPEIERALKLDELVLRYLIVRMDAR